MNYECGVAIIGESGATLTILEICDASQQKVPYVSQAYLKLVSKIACEISRKKEKVVGSSI